MTTLGHAGEPPAGGGAAAAGRAFAGGRRAITAQTAATTLASVEAAVSIAPTSDPPPEGGISMYVVNVTAGVGAATPLVPAADGVTVKVIGLETGCPLAG